MTVITEQFVRYTNWTYYLFRFQTVLLSPRARQVVREIITFFPRAMTSPHGSYSPIRFSSAILVP